jgi:hypothetical protein
MGLHLKFLQSWLSDGFIYLCSYFPFFLAHKGGLNWYLRKWVYYAQV